MQTVKVATVKALHRRLDAYNADVIGKYHVDVQIAYTQIKRRLQAYLDIHKSISKWTESQNDEYLTGIVAFLTDLLEF